MIRIKKITSLLIILCVGLFVACSSNDEDKVEDRLVGTWEIQSLLTNEENSPISSVDDLIQFQAIKIYQSYKTAETKKQRGGWSYTGNMLNISLDLPAAYYLLKVDANELTLKRLDFKADGSLQSQIRQYKRVEDSRIK
ncbi:hypothetical protein AwDysgo_01300 [Bacteroidales bacterium]|nr:hypothetical protein AwDysgo_01300 [Bacteroidales bacterium]